MQSDCLQLNVAHSNRLMRRLLRPQTPSLPMKDHSPSCVTSSPTVHNRISSENRRLRLRIERTFARPTNLPPAQPRLRQNRRSVPNPGCASTVRRRRPPRPQLYLIAWPIGYVEPLQPSEQTISNSLQNSLFSRPKTQKDAGLFLRGSRLRDPWPLPPLVKFAEAISRASTSRCIASTSIPTSPAVVKAIAPSPPE